MSNDEQREVDPGGRLARSRGYKMLAQRDFTGHTDEGRRTAYYEGWKARKEWQAANAEPVQPDREALVERAATAMYENDPGLDSERAWDTAEEWVREEYRSLATVAAAALAAQPVTGTVEWAVRYETHGRSLSVIEYADKDSCMRFIESPPMWFEGRTPNLGSLTVVSRVAASEWAEVN